MPARGTEAPPSPEDQPVPKAIPVDPSEQVPGSLQGYRQIGTYVIRTRMKITGDHVTRIPIKPLEIEVLTNGTDLKIVVQGHNDEASTYEIYRSDGIGRLNKHTGVLEVVPGLQAYCKRDGILRHLRVTREALTITEFAAISDQTMVTHALARPKPRAAPANTAAAGS
jgi:hypothetical protein